MRNLRVVGLVVAVGALAGALGAGGSVWASHQFSDVGDGHTFHDEIGAVASSCISGGFGDGTFRPGRAVARQEMAAFLERGLSHVEVADGAGGTLPGDNGGAVAGPQTLATVSVDIPNLPGCDGQYVELIGRAGVDIPGLKLDRCLAARCTVWLELHEGGTTLGIAEGVLSGDFDVDVMTVTAVVPAEPGNHTYTLAASTWLMKAPPDGGSVYSVRLIAETHPFSDSAG